MLMRKNTKFTINIFITLILTFIVSQNLFAVTNYVSKTGAHVSPFNSWSNAATNIQDAVDAASSGDTVLVNDGTYYPDDEISVTKDITVKSVNGAEKTIVDGNNSHRCFYLNSSNPVIDGFTIVNGGDSTEFGGGVFCENGGTVQNCIISGNSATEGGGVNCTLGGTVQNCIIKENSAYYGGGVRCFYGGIVQNCTISDNTSSYHGGGISCYNSGIVWNCTISGNSAPYGGGVDCDYGGGTIQNSILWNNTGSEISGTPLVNIYNCIENWTNIVNGIITNNPQFVDALSGDYRLKTNSPCINVGTNMAWMVGEKDLYGNPRITDVIVDMGSYEFAPEPVGIIILLAGGFVFARNRFRKSMG